MTEFTYPKPKPTLDNYEPPMWPQPETGSEESFLFRPGVCWICKSQSSLTREHLFKRSHFKKVHKKYPKMQMVISGRKRQIQSDDSKFIKSEACICAGCNNARTQDADKTFDILFARAESGQCFIHPRMGPTLFRSQKEVNLLELYATKVMGCFFAGNGVAIPNRFAEAIMKSDSSIANVFYSIGTTSYAQFMMRGLPTTAWDEVAFMCNPLKHPEEDCVGGYEMSITIGAVTLMLYTQFYGDEISLLNAELPEFIKRMAEARPVRDWPSCPSFLVNSLTDDGHRRFSMIQPNGVVRSVVQVQQI